MASWWGSLNLENQLDLVFLRVGNGPHSLNQICDTGVNEFQTALFVNVENCLGCGLHEESAHLLHELGEIEMNTNGTLELFDVILFKQKFMLLFAWDLSFLTRNRQRFNSLDYERAREIRTDQANHLMVVQSSHDFVMGSLMEYFLDLLEEAFPVEESWADKGVFSKQDVFSFQSGVEVLIEQVEGLFIFTVKDNFDCVLQVDRHLLVVEVVVCFLIESLLGGLSFWLNAKYGPFDGRGGCCGNG
jgi:hypothetical protein